MASSLSVVDDDSGSDGGGSAVVLSDVEGVAAALLAPGAARVAHRAGTMPAMHAAPFAAYQSPAVGAPGSAGGRTPTTPEDDADTVTLPTAALLPGAAPGGGGGGGDGGMHNRMGGGGGGGGPREEAGSALVSMRGRGVASAPAAGGLSRYPSLMQVSPAPGGRLLAGAGDAPAVMAGGVAEAAMRQALSPRTLRSVATMSSFGGVARRAIAGAGSPPLARSPAAAGAAGGPPGGGKGSSQMFSTVVSAVRMTSQRGARSSRARTLVCVRCRPMLPWEVAAGAPRAGGSG